MIFCRGTAPAKAGEWDPIEALPNSHRAGSEIEAGGLNGYSQTHRVH